MSVSHIVEGPGALIPGEGLKCVEDCPGCHHVELVHNTRRMLQALDAYWEHCEGLSAAKSRTVRGRYEAEDWWNRYERYRKQVEEAL